MLKLRIQNGNNKYNEFILYYTAVHVTELYRCGNSSSDFDTI